MKKPHGWGYENAYTARLATITNAIMAAKILHLVPTDASFINSQMKIVAAATTQINHAAIISKCSIIPLPPFLNLALCAEKYLPAPTNWLRHIDVLPCLLPCHYNQGSPFLAVVAK